MSDSLMNQLDECDAPVETVAPVRPVRSVGRKPHKPSKPSKKRVLSPAGTYRCPKCDNEIIVFVRMSALPLCINHSVASGGAVFMEEVK
jgi:ribosomal protein L34E